MRLITYGESHRKIVESGIPAIREVLLSNDREQILSLIFCLDYYLDPYYKHTLPYEKEIYDLLQELVVSSRDEEVVEDCLNLMGSYAGCPLPIMEAHFDQILDSMKPDARYVLNQT